MSMAYIRKTYGVPAKRGMRVRFYSRWGGETIDCVYGVIVGARGGYLRVRLDTDQGISTFHPKSQLIAYEVAPGEWWGPQA